MKKFLLLCSAVLFSAVTFAATMSFTTSEGISLSYTPLNTTTAKLVGGSNVAGNLTIPATIGDYTIVEIDASAFNNCAGLTSVVIPSSVKKIGNNAFYKCSGLTSLVLNEGLESIGNSAFSQTGLTSLLIPASVTSIGNSAFYQCKSLSFLLFESAPESQPLTLGTSVFAGCTELTSALIPSRIETISNNTFNGCVKLSLLSIFEGVKAIGSDAFNSCSKLSKVEFPSSVKSIGRDAFYKCSELTSIVLNEGLESIDSSAFYQTGLTSLSIPTSVTSIGNSVFYQCKSLSTLSFASAPESQPLTLGTSVFAGCTEFSSVLIPSRVQTISASTFEGCTKLTLLTISEGVTTIANKAFSGCSNLLKVEIPSSVKKIDNNAFYKCSGLTSIALNEGLESIGNSAFYQTGVTSLSIPASVTSIGNSAFYKCSGLTSIALNEGLESIGYSAFYQTGMRSLSIPASVTSIGNSAFNKCSGLWDVSFASSSESDQPLTLGTSVFAGCTELSSVLIPSRVQTISSSTFEGCTSLFIVVLETGIQKIASSAFNGCTHLSSISIPSSVKVIDNSAFKRCTELTSVVLNEGLESIGNSAFSQTGISGVLTIPKTVTTIGQYAFSQCFNLSVVRLHENLQSIGASAFDLNGSLECMVFEDGEPPPCGFGDFTNSNVEVLYPDTASWRALVASFKFTSATHFFSHKNVQFHWDDIPISTPTTWNANVTHWVYSNIIVRAEGELTIAPSAVVKFFSGRKLIVEEGATVIANGVTFTLVYDRDVGLDVTTIFGSRQPKPYEYKIEGKITTDEATVFKYYDPNVPFYTGTFNEDVTFKSGCVYIIGGSVVVPNGKTLTIENGAIVKFTPGASLDINEGGVCIANGAIFTHFSDDSFGGDTNMDGTETLPVYDDYSILGNVLDDVTTQYCYIRSTIQGAIEANTLWRNRVVIQVTGNLNIKKGATLTIEPGCIIKVAEGASITVEQGATLNVEGTLARPVVITSIKDDTAGGDTNGDGNQTSPQGGDWMGIWVYGSANCAYTTMMYAGPRNEYGIVQTLGTGELTLTNCVVAHSKYDGIWNWGGSIVVKNSVVFDTCWATAPYRGMRNEFINCVFYDNNVGMTYWSQWSGKPIYKNCIFMRCSLGWCETGRDTYTNPQFRDDITINNSCFWNPPGFGLQTCDRVGVQSNIWGDPLFINPNQGDFRIASNSPCIDAADTTIAPEVDYYGQPRLTYRNPSVGTKELADIGIYEVMPRGVKSDIDLVPQQVEASEEVSIGEKIEIKWTTVNIGSGTVTSTWRDTISLVSTSGEEIVLGENVCERTLVSNEAVQNKASFVVPSLTEGEWSVKVCVNSYRDVFEGDASKNNVARAIISTTISIETLDVASVHTGTIVANEQTALKFSFGKNEKKRMMYVDVPEGVMVKWGFGFVPQDTTYTGMKIAGTHGVYISVPINVENVYVVIESDVACEYKISTEDTTLKVVNVSPNKLPLSGSVTMTIEGAGFERDNTVTLSRARESYQATKTSIDAEGNLSAVVDCSKLQAGAIYTLTVSNGTDTSTLIDAVTIENVKGEGHFWCELIMADVSRAGRISVGKLRYGNSGTADMLAPLVDIVSKGDGLLSHDGMQAWTSILRVVAVGNSSNPILLMPGEECEINFFVMSNTENHFAVYTSIDETAEVDWRDYNLFYDDLGEACRRLGWCGEQAFIYERVYSIADSLRIGEFDNALGGTISFEGNKPIEGLILSLYTATGDELECIQTCTLTNSGQFAFLNLADGDYVVKIGETVLTEEAISLKNGIFVDNVDFTYTYVREIIFKITNAENPIDATSVTLTSITSPGKTYYPIAISNSNEVHFESTIPKGAYRAHCSSMNGEGFLCTYLSENSNVFETLDVQAPVKLFGSVEQIAQNVLPERDVILFFRGNTSGRIYEVTLNETQSEFSLENLFPEEYTITYSGLTCSYEPDIPLSFEGGEEYSVKFSPLSSTKCITVKYPVAYANCLLIAAGPDGTLTARCMDNTGSATFHSLCDGMWVVLVADEDNNTIAMSQFVVSDKMEEANLELEEITSRRRELSSSPVTLFNVITDSVKTAFKKLTTWAGEGLAKVLPPSIMNRFETKEWKEAQAIQDSAMKYLSSHRKISPPSKQCSKCGAAMNSKYNADKAALERFSKSLNDFIGYKGKCSSMKTVASTSKAVANVSQRVADRVIDSYVGGFTKNMDKLLTVLPKVHAVINTFQNIKDLGDTTAEGLKAIEDLTSNISASLDGAIAATQSVEALVGQKKAILDLQDIITTLQDGSNPVFGTNSALMKNKALKESLEGIGDAMSILTDVLSTIQDVEQIAKDANEMLDATGQFSARKDAFMKEFERFKRVASSFNSYVCTCKDENPIPSPPPQVEPEIEVTLPEIVKPDDPNEIVGPLGFGDIETERFVKPGSWMTYTVYFENKSTATAAAQEVYVTNPLSEYLDWSTFEMGEVAYNNQIDLGLDKKQNGTSEASLKGTNYHVRTTVDVNQGTGEVNWYLRIVDHSTITTWPDDAYAGILPPNDETHCGEGHLTYRVKVREDAPANVKIQNSAVIIFDYNESIETDPAWWNTVAPHFKQTFDAAGGTGGTSVTQEYGAPLSAPIVTRDGYVFDKWDPVVPETVPAKDTTYKALWKAKQYTMTFNANGGAGGKTVTQNYGSALAAPTMTREGYTFTGWSPAVPKTVPAMNATYTAQWKVNQYKATFNANGGAGGKSVTQNYGSALAAPKVTREGYTFTGWSPAVPKTVPAKNMTYTAQWKVNQYTMTFNANGGVGGTVKTQNYGSALAAPKVTREGYTFTGWLPAVPKTVPAMNATYTAQWKKSSVDLSLLTMKDNFKKKQVTINGCVTPISGHLEIPEWIVRKDPKSGMDVQLMVVGIGNGAFQNQAKLEKVTLPNTITSIGKDAFKNCVSLDVNAIVMPNHPKLKVGKGAFTGCKVTAITAVPGEPKAGTNVAGYKVATSVSGFKLNAKLGTWTATFKKPGLYEAVLFKPGVALKAVRINVGAFPTVTIKTEGADAKCSVKGAGAYLMGKKVSLSAKASKEKIFLGFYDEKGTRLTAPDQTKYSFVMSNKTVTVTAKFTVEKITIDTTAITQAQWRVGQHYTILLPVDAESGVKTVKAKLPSGLKLTKMTDKWYVTGSPKKAGAYTASFTVNTQQKKSLTKFAVITVAVEDVKVGVDLLKNTTFQLGVPTIGIPITAHSPSGIKSVKASKLPAGMKVQKVNDQWIVTGTPKKAGTYYVTLTITTKAGSKWVQVVPVIVAEPLTWMAGRYEGVITYNWYDDDYFAWDNMLGYAIVEIDANGNIVGAAALTEFNAYGVVDAKATVVEQTANKIKLHVTMDWYDEVTDEFLTSYPTDLILEKRGNVVTLTYQSTYSSTDYMTGVLSKE